MFELLKHWKSDIIEEARTVESSKNSRWYLQIAKALLMYVWSVFIMGLALIVTAGVALLINKDIARTVFDSEFSANLISIVGLAMVYVVANRTERLSKKALGIEKDKAAIKYGIGAIVGLVAFGAVLGFGFVSTAFRYSGIHPETTIIPIILACLGFVLQAFFEEFFFKSYMIPMLSRKMSVVASVLISSIVFAAVHSFNDGIGFISILNLFLFAIFTSCYFLKTNNVWGVAGFHAVWNIVQGTVCGFNVSGNPTNTSIFMFSGIKNELMNGGDFGPEGGLLVTCVLALGIVVVLWTIIRDAETFKNKK